MNDKFLNKTLWIKRVSTFPRWAEGIALIGGIWFFIQLWISAHVQESVLDEGAYLYKGWLFVTGQYTLYQPYGPWSNHMPLAFLIPGAIQRLLGPGLDTGRYFAIFVAMLMLFGMWWLVVRLRGKWWAATAVWLVVWNPAMAKMYSVAVSQGLVACMLVWMLFFILGERRSLWQIGLGSILAGLIVMTRNNMLPILPWVVLYIYWQHGKRAGMLSAILVALVVVVGHAIYWPDILQVWTKFPRKLTPFLDAWRVPKAYARNWKSDTSIEGRLLSFFRAIRFHFTAMVGTMVAWLLWSSRKRWKTESDFRSVVFLSSLFFVLLITHMWATMGKDYCTFCLEGYLAFFFVLGLLTLILSVPSWRFQSSWWQQGIIMIAILSLSVGIGYGAFEDVGESLLNISIPKRLLGSPSPGYATLQEILINKFTLEPQFLRRVVPAMFGLLVGLLIIALAFGIKRLMQQGFPPLRTSIISSVGNLSLILFLFIGTVLSPNQVLGGGYRAYECGGNVLESYKLAGKHLAEIITPGTLVYWKGSLSIVPLLYVPHIRIFPPQINDGYSFFTIGETEVLLRFGYWNDELSRQWAEEADYVLIEERSFKGWLREKMLSGGYVELNPTPPLVACREDSQIRIFQHIR